MYILGSEIHERRTYLGSEILRTEKKYLGSTTDGKLTYLGSEILRAKSNYLGS